MSRLYFVRHGQSEWNVANRICGQTDIPLTDKGRRQAEQTADKILAEGIRADLILYSPLSRAAETARIISARTGIPARMEPRLIEQCSGVWEGTPRDSAEFRAARAMFACSYGRGESMLRLAQRIYNLLDDLKRDPSGQAVMLVAHNGIARVVESYFRDMTNEEYADFGIRNCEIRAYDL